MDSFIAQALLVLGFMVFYNSAIHRVLKQKYHLSFALVMSGVVVWLASISNLSWADIGFANPVRGAIYGLVISVALVLLISAAASYRRTRSYFTDERVVGISIKKLLNKTLIDIPLTTVLFEELLFRGLILAILLNNYSSIEAIAISSALFGLWHIWPAIAFAKTNKKASGFPIATLFGTVAFTGATGFVFGWLRVESGSLLAPMMLHFASNSGSFFASWLANNAGLITRSSADK